MIIETRDIGSYVHVVYTSPGDASAGDRPEHYYYGRKKIVGIYARVGAAMQPEVTYQYEVKYANGTTGTSPVFETDAFDTEEEARAAIKERESNPDDWM